MEAKWQVTRPWRESKLFYLFIKKKQKNKWKFCVPGLSPGLESCPHKEPSGQTVLSGPPLLPFGFPASSPLSPSNGLLQFLPPAWDTQR